MKVLGDIIPYSWPKINRRWRLETKESVWFNRNSAESWLGQEEAIKAAQGIAVVEIARERRHKRLERAVALLAWAVPRDLRDAVSRCFAERDHKRLDRLPAACARRLVEVGCVAELAA